MRHKIFSLCFLSFFLVGALYSQDPSTPINHTLDNGFEYTITENSTPEDFLTIQLNISHTMTSLLTVDPSIAELSGYAVFFGTWYNNKESIAEQLHSMGMDISPAGHVVVTPVGTLLSFKLSYENQEQLPHLLNLLADMAQNSNLDETAIELARSELIEQLENLPIPLDETSTEARIHHLKTITATQVQEHYKQWWRSDLMHLYLLGAKDNAASEEEIKTSFQSMKKPDNAAFKLKFERADGQEEEETEVEPEVIVIDGKIYMNPPRALEAQETGYWFGIILAVVGAGCLLGAFIFNPMLAVLGISSIAGGAYFALDPYLTDPEVVREKRVEDLEHGFLHAYMHGRAGHTLTPCERRVMFLNENLKYTKELPKQLSDFPILHLSDIFKLDDAVFKAMLYHSERNSLEKLKKDFLCERNSFKNERYSLEEELQSLLRPHQILRDIALDNARKKYEATPAVRTLREFQAELGRQIDSIWEMWRNELITDHERDRRIEQTEKYYRELMEDEKLVAEVSKARKEMEREQDEILKEYAEAEKRCKEYMNYEERLKRIEQGLWGLYARYTEYQLSYMSSMPFYDAETFPDFLDLRK